MENTNNRLDHLQIQMQKQEFKLQSAMRGIQQFSSNNLNQQDSHRARSHAMKLARASYVL